MSGRCHECGHVICTCDEWRGNGDSGLRVEILAKDEQIRVLTARLAAAEAERDETSQYVSDLVMLVSRLVQQVRNHDETNDVAEKAMDYLRRKDLILSIIRGIESVAASSSGGDDE